MNTTVANKQKKSRPSHDRSTMLSHDENNRIIQFIEKINGVILAIGIVQLWLSSPQNHSHWSKIHTGVICFVIDYTKKSYFFRLISLNLNLLWEQEIYRPFSYTRIARHFHYFPADECNAGFNFTSEEEAEKYYNIVITKVNSINEKHLSHTSGPDLSPTSSILKSSLTQTIGNFVGNLVGNSSQKNITQKSKKLDKSQIGRPTNFNHEQQIKYKNNALDIKLNDDLQSQKIRQFISQIGFPKLKITKDVEEFIHGFIQENGGMHLFEEELEKRKLQSEYIEQNLIDIDETNLIKQNTQGYLQGSMLSLLHPQLTPIPLNIANQKAPSLIPSPVSSNIVNQTVSTVPPPPPPPPVLSTFDNNQPSTSLLSNNLVIPLKSSNTASSFTQERPNFLKEIEGLNKANLRPVRENRPAKAILTTENGSIIDQLRNELIKRAPYLNDSSNDEKEESDSEWQ